MVELAHQQTDTDAMDVSTDADVREDTSDLTAAGTDYPVMCFPREKIFIPIQKENILSA